MRFDILNRLVRGSLSVTAGRTEPLARSIYRTALKISSETSPIRAANFTGSESVIIGLDRPWSCMSRPSLKQGKYLKSKTSLSSADDWHITCQHSVDAMLSR